jgi:hypothetical protein
MSRTSPVASNPSGNSRSVINVTDYLDRNHPEKSDEDE